MARFQNATGGVIIKGMTSSNTDDPFEDDEIPNDALFGYGSSSAPLARKPDYRNVLVTVNRVIAANYVTSPPILIDDIAENYGLKVLYGELPPEMGDVAGYIMLQDEEKVVLINSLDSPVRQRFTIAHELGHYLLHVDALRNNPKYGIMKRHPIGQGDNDVYEIEANFFASRLLVPKFLLEQYEQLPHTRMATIFAVSSDVIGYRLRNQNAPKRRSR